MPSPFERIVEVEFSDKVSRASPTWRLVLEVIGSRSNLILVHGASDDASTSCAVKGEIAACAYQVSGVCVYVCISYQVI